MDFTPKNQRKLMVNIFMVAVAIILFYWVVNNFSQVLGGIGWVFGVLGPFIAGFIIAYFLGIPADSIQKLLCKVKIGFIAKASRGLSILLVYLIIIATIYLAAVLLVPPLVASIISLASSIPMFIQQFIYFINSINYGGQLPFHIDLEEVSASILAAIDLDVFAYDVIMAQLRIVGDGAAFMFSAIIAFISSIYILFEREKIGRFVKRLINKFMSPKAAEVILDYSKKTDSYFKKYIVCVLIDCLAMAIVAPIVLTILGSPYALLLGLMLGVMNFIPVFGSIVATIIAIIVVLLTQGFAAGLIAAVVLLILQRIDADVFQPWLYGGSLKLSPLLVIMCITIGGSIGSVIGGFSGMVAGMFIAIPCTKVLANIVEDILNYEKPKPSLEDQ